MTDTPEAVRLEFERYFLESRKSKGTNRNPTFERFEDGTYKDDHTQRHWWTWQNALLRRIPELEAEVQEQARLNGMGAERELALMAQVSRLEAERDGLNAARFAYASEFGLDDEGQPDVGSIHQNIRALKAELEKVRVPEGWKLVPVEPTREMWAAVNKLDDEMAAGGYDGKGCSIEQAWNCLLDFAPTPPNADQKGQ